MVRVEIFRSPAGEVSGFISEGHAGYAAKGSDIVCAAVSALTFSAVNGLSHYVGIRPEIEIDEESGTLRCFLPPDAMDREAAAKAQAILETMALGLQETAREYSDYLVVKEVLRS